MCIREIYFCVCVCWGFCVYDNVYVYNAYFAFAKKCYEVNNNQSLFSFANSQYSFSSDNSCIEYCTDYLNDIQSSNYSCYDCSLSDPILYKKNKSLRRD